MVTVTTQKFSSLKLRANILAKIREFFAVRNILEVETPLLSHSTNPAPHLQSFETFLDFPSNKQKLFLQTSPEFAMKRLLAAGSGDIFQICKAFRNSESGRIHNPEFTILEWYRVGFTHFDLMAEMDKLLKFVIGAGSAKCFTYQAIFEKYLQFNPHNVDAVFLQNVATANGLNIAQIEDDKDIWLQLLFSHLIEPKIGREVPCFVYDFPASQAMLARLNNSVPETAARFEVYFKGIELANGFYELKDAAEQRQRFIVDLEQRKILGMPAIPLDENFLNALPNLPDCAGVALGIDRLLLIAAEAKSFAEIMAFTVENA